MEKPNDKLTVRELAVKTWELVRDHELLTRASAIAFSSMMAAVPLLALLLTACVFLLPDLTGSGATGIGNLTPEQLEAALRSILPDEAFKIVAEQIARMQHQPPIALISVSLAITLWTASSLFVDVIDALNRIYGMVERRPYWRLRLTAIMLTILQTLILFGGLIAILSWPRILEWLSIESGSTIAMLLQWVFMFGGVLASFALVFHVGPDSLQRKQWVTPGSLFGAFVFLVASAGFRYYVSNFAHYDKLYGSLGGVMALLLWFWISSVVLLVAAELNKIIEYASTTNEERKKKNKDDKDGSPDGEGAGPAADAPNNNQSGDQTTGPSKPDSGSDTKNGGGAG